jgi:hypothetical protein
MVLLLAIRRYCMLLDGFAVVIPEGRERGDGYVDMVHATNYTIMLSNSTRRRCDAEITAHGQLIGVWRLEAQSLLQVERSVDDFQRFTFYKPGTPEAMNAYGSATEQAGLIRVTFKPEQQARTEQPVQQGESGIPDRPVHTVHDSYRRVSPGGSNLSDDIQQQMLRDAPLDYDASMQVTIHLRLVARDKETHTPKQRSTPIPPPIS